MSAPLTERLRRIAGHWRPPARVPVAEWVAANVRLPRGVSPAEGPWARHLFPYLDGVLEAWGDAGTREIDLVFATRLGKTTVMQATLAFAAALDPGPAMVVLPDRAKAKQVSRRLQAVLEATPATAALLPPRQGRDSFNLRVGSMMVYFAWSGGPTSLGDLAIKYLYVSEADKLSRDSTLEADPLDLALERVKGFPGAKVVIESTPSVLGASRIWRRWESSRRHHYELPCPRCGNFQALVMPQLRWPEGSDPSAARRAARLRCAACDAEIDDAEKMRLLKLGRWRAIAATAAGDGSRFGRRAGFQLASLAGALVPIGEVAEKFLEVKDRPAELRNFINSWLAEPWSPSRRQRTVEEIAERLATDRPAGTLPDEAIFLTAGIDRQIDHLPWVVLAWGAGGRAWIVDYGRAADLSEIDCNIVRAVYARNQGKGELRIERALVDSGYDTDAIYRWCSAPERRRRVNPSKGVSHLASGRPLERRPLAEVRGRNPADRAIKQALALLLVHVNTDYWNTWLQHRLDEGTADELALCREAAADDDFLAQLTNGELQSDWDVRGRERLLWLKVRPYEPDDYRDAVRYAAAAAELVVRGNWRRLIAETKTTIAPRPSRRPRDREAGAGRIFSEER